MHNAKQVHSMDTDQPSLGETLRKLKVVSLVYTPSPSGGASLPAHLSFSLLSE